MVKIRRKGVAIVHTNKGILVVSGRRKIFMLPGGGADRGESRRKATIRELKEETNLKAKSTKFLWKYVGRRWRTYSGKEVRNHTKVFLVKTYGKPRPGHEIKYLAYWKPGSKVRISDSTRVLINKYLNL